MNVYVYRIVWDLNPEESSMDENDLIPIDIKKIAITNVTCVIVVGDRDREFPIYIEPGIGAAIRMFIEDIEKPRPLTHDLVGSILEGFGAVVNAERKVLAAAGPYPAAASEDGPVRGGEGSRVEGPAALSPFVKVGSGRQSLTCRTSEIPGNTAATRATSSASRSRSRCR